MARMSTQELLVARAMLKKIVNLLLQQSAKFADANCLGIRSWVRRAREGNFHRGTFVQLECQQGTIMSCRRDMPIFILLIFPQ